MSNRTIILNDSTNIYRSDDDGDSWYKFHSIDLLVNDFLCLNDGESLILGYAPDRSWKIMSSIREGEWHVLSESSRPGNLRLVSQNSLDPYLLEFSNNVLYLHDLKKPKKSPKIYRWNGQVPFSMDDITIVQDLIYFVGHYIGKHHTIVACLDVRNNTLDTVYETENEYLPFPLNFYDDVFSMVVSKTEGFGISTKIITSNDRARS